MSQVHCLSDPLQTALGKMLTYFAVRAYSVKPLTSTEREIDKELRYREEHSAYVVLSWCTS